MNSIHRSNLARWRGVAGLMMSSRGVMRVARSTLVCQRDIRDGETWSAPCEPFCTLRCALNYARKAWRAR